VSLKQVSLNDTEEDDIQFIQDVIILLAMFIYLIIFILLA